MLKVFSKCLLLAFPVLSSRNSVLKRSQILGLRPRTCTTFPALKNWEKKELTLGKTFLTENLDNYSNKIHTILLMKNGKVTKMKDISYQCKNI